MGKVVPFSALISFYWLCPSESTSCNRLWNFGTIRSSLSVGDMKVIKAGMDRDWNKESVYLLLHLTDTVLKKSIMG